jgi:hypothetical protein
VPWLAIIGAVVVCGGGALAAATADRRLAVLGLTVAIVAAPLIGTRAPDLLSLAFREVAALTGAYLLWISGGRGRPTEHREDGPLFPAIFVVLAFVGTLILAPALGPDRGPIVGLAAAAAAAMAALALTVRATDLLAGGLGTIMLLLAASLATTGLAGTNGPLEHAVTGAALLAVSAAAAFVGSGQPSPTTQTPAPLEAEGPPAQNDPFPALVEPPTG